MRFKVYGPYDIGVEKGHQGWIDKEDTDKFWKEVERKSGIDLSQACGVYLFGMRGEQGKKGKLGKTLPWYVGKAESQIFRHECLSTRNYKNLYTFNSVLVNEYKGRGTPFLYLLARVGEDDKPSPPAKGRDDEYWGVRFVEQMFMQISLKANPKLANISTTAISRQISIQGLLNTTKYPSPAVDELKGMFGINLEPAEIVNYGETKYRYEVYRRVIPMKNSQTIDAERVEEMWSELERTKTGNARNLSAACGVYVIGMLHGKNTTPWYVGTAYHKSFKDTCFQSDSEEKVFRKNGKPVVFLFPQLEERRGNLEQAKPKLMSGKPKEMDYVQGVLLEHGVQANPHIMIGDYSKPGRIDILRNLYVEGFVKRRQGSSKPVRELKSLLRQG